MNLGESNNFFRESFRGFNKDDVAEYIVKLNKDYSANEEKYKAIIVKLTAEVKAKTEELETLGAGSEQRPEIPLDEIEQKYKEEINRLVNELNEKDVKIINLQAVGEQVSAEKDFNAPAEVSELKEEIERYKETIANLSKEIEELKENFKQTESQNTAELESKTINQLSFQLAECESEKLFLFNLLKKFVFILNIESARNKNIENIAVLSDIGSKANVSGEIESELNALIQLKVQIAALEAENAEYKNIIDNNQAVRSSEQQMYESITADLGGIIYSAKKSAEEILTKAREDSENIINNANSEANDIIENAKINKAAIIEEKNKIMADFKEKYELIKSEYETMVQNYKDISGRYASQLSELENAINNIYNTVSMSSENFGE